MDNCNYNFGAPIAIYFLSDCLKEQVANKYSDSNTPSVSKRAKLRKKRKRKNRKR